MPTQKVFIIKGTFGFEVAPADVIVNLIDSSSEQIIFENHSGNDAEIKGVPGLPDTILDCSRTDPKPSVTVTYQQADAQKYSGAHRYKVKMVHLGFDAKGNSDPRIIIYR